MNALKNDETSLILITHDMGVIWEMCDRIIVMYASKIVEEGSVESVFENPRHPYTKALLQSIPVISKSGGRLSTIEGQVPSPLNYPQGCRFNDRCPMRMERCESAEPPLVEVENDARVACFLHQ